MMTIDRLVLQKANNRQVKMNQSKKTKQKGKTER